MGIKHIKSWVAVFASMMIFALQSEAQDYQPGRVYTKAERDSLRFQVEQHPDSLSYHMSYIYSYWPDKDALLSQYRMWMKQFPDVVAVPLSLGTMFYRGEYPEAKEFLSAALLLNPHLPEAYYMLSMDAHRWGNKVAAMEFMRRAWQEAPDNASYGFYFTMDLGRQYPDSFRSKVYELAKRYPDDERAAQGLFILGTSGSNVNVKMAVLEDLIKFYPPSRFRWSASGLLRLYDFYLPEYPEKALALSSEMANEYRGPRDTLARQVIEVKSLISRKQFAQAAEVAEGLKVPYRSNVTSLLLLLKSELAFASGKGVEAYQNLVADYAVNPTDDVEHALKTYSTKLGKKEAEIWGDIRRIRDVNSSKATPFSLGLYTSDRKLNLDDYRGKVVLLTFWFPGCGPCRAEFPHFQNVVNQFSAKELGYLGVNVFPEQDAYILPFMKSSKYSFVPLRGNPKWAKEAYSVKAEPTNFLIDQQGKIVFSNFRIDEGNERTLYLMIESLLQRKISL